MQDAACAEMRNGGSQSEQDSARKGRGHRLRRP